MAVLAPGRRFALQGRLQAFLRQGLADAVDRGQAHVERLGDLRVAPVRAVRVGFQQDPGSQEHRRRAPAGVDQAEQLRAFFRGQPHDELCTLAHVLLLEKPPKENQLAHSCQFSNEGVLAYFARLGRAFPPGVLRATAARMSARNAPALTSSPSWMSIARLVFPPRLELKSLAGSSSEAPLAKVIFTTSLYVSPVQMIPACDHTGTPNIEFDGFLHFTSSTTSGSACLMRLRIRASISPRQSLSSLNIASFR